MNKTKSQKYNENLDKIFDPEIKRLKKIEEVSNEVLYNLKQRVEIDYCGLDECHLINIITDVIKKFIN